MRSLKLQTCETIQLLILNHCSFGQLRKFLSWECRMALIKHRPPIEDPTNQKNMPNLQAARTRKLIKFIWCSLICLLWHCQFRSSMLSIPRFSKPSRTWIHGVQTGSPPAVNHHHSPLFTSRNHPLTPNNFYQSPHISTNPSAWSSPTDRIAEMKLWHVHALIDAAHSEGNILGRMKCLGSISGLIRPKGVGHDFLGNVYDRIASTSAFCCSTRSHNCFDQEGVAAWL